MSVRGIDVVQRNIDLWWQGKRRKLATAMEEIAAILENYAKSHHEWKPETGATDVSTVGQISRVLPEMIEVTLSAGMEYDVFLELAREGKWAWLWPAVEANTDEIRRILKEAMSD